MICGSPQKYAVGSKLLIEDEDGNRTLWVVLKRVRRGYRLEPDDGGDTWTLTDAAITDMRPRITYLPPRSGLSRKHEALLEEAWETYRDTWQRDALRKAAFVRAVDALRDAGGVTRAEAVAAATVQVWAARHEEWQREEDEAYAAAEEERLRRRRKPPEALKRPARRIVLKAPTPRAVEHWCDLWVASGRDVRVLIPLHGHKGDRRPRFKGDAAVVYEEMREAVEEHHLSKRRGKFASVHREVTKKLKSKGLKVSRVTVTRFVRKNWSDGQVLEAQYNKLKARQKVGVFARQPTPKRPLLEVEVDHYLADVLVKLDAKGRVLGRPWITVVLDRCTRCVLGLHISFEPPSWASLQRALAHAFWPKDLTGLGLSNPWPCEGVPVRVFVDNGREFHSRHLAAAALLMGFEIVYTTARHPWMKGKIERLFRRMGVCVFDLLEGKTFSNSVERGEYKSVKRAKSTLAEIKSRLLSWIVDDYHVEYHEGLKGIPLHEWNRLADEEPVDGVRSYADIRRLLGASYKRKISNVGVKIFGFVYTHPELEALRMRAGGATRDWDIRADPFDLGTIELLDDERGIWLLLRSDEPELTEGVSYYQLRRNNRRARTLADGGGVTTEVRRRAKMLEEAENADALGNARASTTAAGEARYGLSNGAFITPLAGAPAPANDAGRAPAPATRAAPKADAEPSAEPVEADVPVASAVDDAYRETVLAKITQWTNRRA